MENNKWISIKEQLPEPFVPVFVRRNKSNNVYIGFRLDKPLTENPDASRDCYWYGNSFENFIGDIRGDIKIFNNFSDITVSEWHPIIIPAKL
jgi:Protein of unknown function (DUF551)